MLSRENFYAAAFEQSDSSSEAMNDLSQMTSRLVQQQADREEELDPNEAYRNPENLFSAVEDWQPFHFALQESIRSLT